MNNETDKKNTIQQLKKHYSAMNPFFFLNKSAMNPKLDISEVKPKRKFTNNLEDDILLTRKLVYNNK